MRDPDRLVNVQLVFTAGGTFKKPIVTVPSDFFVEATGESGATVSYNGVSAVDDVDGPVGFTCGPASGTIFPLGTTTVTCTATDASGNQSECAFPVVVHEAHRRGSR